MNQPPEYMEFETTGDMAKRVRQANRHARARIVAALGLVLAIFLVWFMIGRRACQEKLGSGGSEPPRRPAAAIDTRSWVVDPTATTATVRVVLTGPGPLTVDGQFATPEGSQVLKLEPGPHILAAHIRGAVVQQYLTVKAGEEFAVTFDDATKDVRLDRVPPPK